MWYNKCEPPSTGSRCRRRESVVGGFPWLGKTKSTLRLIGRHTVQRTVMKSEHGGRSTNLNIANRGACTNVSIVKHTLKLAEQVDANIMQRIAGDTKLSTVLIARHTTKWGRVAITAVALASCPPHQPSPLLNGRPSSRPSRDAVLTVTRSPRSSPKTTLFHSRVVEAIPQITLSLPVCAAMTKRERNYWPSNLRWRHAK